MAAGSLISRLPCDFENHPPSAVIVLTIALLFDQALTGRFKALALGRPDLEIPALLQGGPQSGLSIGLFQEAVFVFMISILESFVRGNTRQIDKGRADDDHAAIAYLIIYNNYKMLSIKFGWRQMMMGNLWGNTRIDYTPSLIAKRFFSLDGEGSNPLSIICCITYDAY